jgi:hypothetical protein
MKKRAFLLPLSASVASLAAGSALATPAAPLMVDKQKVEETATGAAPMPFVLERSQDGVQFAQHRSHASHASHASHSSHYSSR